jgi:hypothetical protein
MCVNNKYICKKTSPLYVSVAYIIKGNVLLPVLTIQNTEMYLLDLLQIFMLSTDCRTSIVCLYVRYAVYFDERDYTLLVLHCNSLGGLT